MRPCNSRLHVAGTSAPALVAPSHPPRKCKGGTALSVSPSQGRGWEQGQQEASCDAATLASKIQGQTTPRRGEASPMGTDWAMQAFSREDRSQWSVVGAQPGPHVPLCPRQLSTHQAESLQQARRACKSKIWWRWPGNLCGGWKVDHQNPEPSDDREQTSFG